MPQAHDLTAPPEHSMQLFDSDDSAAGALAAFVAEGFAKGEHILLVTRLRNWNRAAVELARQIPLSDAIASGRLVVRDSARTLDALLVDGMPVTEWFDKTVGNLVSECAVPGAGLRAYGDMVDLLAAEGRFDAAERLEELWNGLRTRIPFTLFCGYSSGHFCNAGNDEALRRIRGVHSHEQCAPTDLVAGQLMEQTAAQTR